MKRCSPPPSASTFFVTPGYRDSRSFRTSPSVAPSAVTLAWSSANLRRIVGSLTVTGIGFSNSSYGSGGDAAELLVIDQPRDGRLFATHGAVGVPADLHLLEVHMQSVVQEEASLERIALPRRDLDRLGRLDRADHTRKDPEHATLGAARDGARWRRGREQASVTGGLLPRHEDRGLALELVDRAVDERLAHELRRIVDEVTDREVVRAVDDDVVALEDLEHVRREKQRLVADHPDRGVDRSEVLDCRIDLRAADVGGGVEDLALQVGLVDPVEVHDAELAVAGGRQIHRDRGAESAGADHQHRAVEQLPLTPAADVRQDDMAGVALHLVLGEARRRRPVHAIESSSSVITPSRIQNERTIGSVLSASHTTMYRASG